MTTLWRWRTEDSEADYACASIMEAICECVADLDLWEYDPHDADPVYREGAREAAALGDLVVCDDAGGRILRVDLAGTVIGLRAWVVPAPLLGNGEVTAQA